MNNYQIERAPEQLVLGRRASKTNFPLVNLNIGEMFRIDSSLKTRTSVYNAIKHGRKYSGLLAGREFRIRKLSESEYAVVRTK